MKFILENGSKENISTLTRSLGYHFLNQNTGPEEMSFIRPLERNGYPRFHLYIKKAGNDLAISLHLDQKRPIYKGVSAHAGEYDGAVVERELERIKEMTLAK